MIAEICLDALDRRLEAYFVGGLLIRIIFVTTAASLAGAFFAYKVEQPLRCVGDRQQVVQPAIFPSSRTLGGATTIPPSPLVSTPGAMLLSTVLTLMPRPG